MNPMTYCLHSALIFVVLFKACALFHSVTVVCVLLQQCTADDSQEEMIGVTLKEINNLSTSLLDKNKKLVKNVILENKILLEELKNTGYNKPL